MTGSALAFPKEKLLSRNRVARRVRGSRVSIQRVHESRESVQFSTPQIETRHACEGNAVANHVADFLNGLIADPAIAGKAGSLIGPASIRAVTTDAALGVYSLAFRQIRRILSQQHGGTEDKSYPDSCLSIKHVQTRLHHLKDHAPSTPRAFPSRTACVSVSGKPASRIFSRAESK